MKCKFCPFETTRASLLRSHAAVEHQAAYRAIQRWLHDTTDEKLQAAETLTAEGMKGLKSA